LVQPNCCSPLHERNEPRLSFRVVRSRIHEHPDAPHALALLRARAQNGHAAAPPSSVMNSRRLMPDMGAPSQSAAAADHTSWGPPGAGGLTHQEPAGGRVSRSLGQT
jgi:hypothetical protein